MKNSDRLKAINLFLDDVNTAVLTKDEIIEGIKAISGNKLKITPPVEKLYMRALKKIYKGRK